MPLRPVLPGRAVPAIVVFLIVGIVSRGVPATAQGPAGVLPSAGPVGPPKDIGELRSIEDRVKRVAVKVLPAVVAVTVGGSQGSGVVVTKEGIVLTAGHVTVKPNEKIDLEFPDGKKVHAITLGLNKEADAGMARITDKGEWPCVEMAQAGTIRPGTWCVAVGHPLGRQAGRPPVIRLGRVLRVFPNGLQTDCTLVAGDSGGPVFDLDGRVIGINSRIAPNSARMNFHVLIDVYHQAWEKMLKGEVFRGNVEGKDSAEVKNAFRPVVAEAGRCVVEIKCDGQKAALGTVVGPDGWVLSKASQLKGKTVCRMRDGQEREARIVGVNSAFDLAMLKIERGKPAHHPVGPSLAAYGGRMGGHAGYGRTAAGPRRVERSAPPDRAPPWPIGCSNRRGQ